MRSELRSTNGAAAVLLAAALVCLTGCTLLHREPEPPLPPASVQMLAQADEAWQARDFEEARRLYEMVAESYPGDPARQEACLRLAMMDVVLPGDGPNLDRALDRLALMDGEALTADQAATRGALVELLGLYREQRDAVRMLAEQNHRLEAELNGQKLEAIRKEAKLYQWREDVDQANQRVEQLEVELEKIRQEIKLLKDIDMMLQKDTGEEPPPADQQR